MRISDWSSDVCSSDLILSSARRATHVVTPSKAMLDSLLLWAPEIADKCSVNRYGTVPAFRGGRTRQWRADGTLRLLYVSVYYARSEDRRGGKECVSTCRSRWSPSHYKKKEKYK